MTDLVLWREKLQRSREERIKFTQRWLNSLEAFVGDDTTLMRVSREQSKDAGEFAKVAQCAADQLLRDTKPNRDRVFFHRATISRLLAWVKRAKAAA